MANLGWLYRDGQGVPRDYAKAREWYEKAAAAGYSGAMVNVGWLYQNGRGVPQDYAKAREWYEKAAAAGNAIAMTELGWLYRNGLGRGAGLRQGARVVREGGRRRTTASGMHGLGLLYEQRRGRAQGLRQGARVVREGGGRPATLRHEQPRRALPERLGVPQDYAKAREWYEKAIASNNRFAPRNLAILLDNGKGGPTDYPRAAKLLLEAAKANNTAAIEDLRSGMAKWNKSTRIEVKRELSRLGHLSGADQHRRLGRRRAATAVNNYLGQGR